jgi:hypothetical protein
MITSGSTEFFPLIRKLKKPNVTRQGVFISKLDSIDVTAENIISNGGGNFVGEGCESINLLNCVGCAVTSGVTGVNLIDCSGVTVSENDVTFIDNLQITEGSFISSGVTFSQGYKIISDSGVFVIGLDDYTIVSVGINSMSFFIPPALGHTQVFNIKNNRDEGIGEVLTVIMSSGDTLDNEPVPSPFIRLNRKDNLTVQSNGSNGYIIL